MEAANEALKLIAQAKKISETGKSEDEFLEVIKLLDQAVEKLSTTSST